MQLTRHDNLNLLALPDCGGLLENGKCGWLNVSACTGVGCSSYRKQNADTQVYERLRSLSESDQEYIARKYYAGSRPWAAAE